MNDSGIAALHMDECFDDALLVGRLGTGRQVSLPAVSTWMCRWFRGYVRSYLARHFHSVCLLGAPPSVTKDTPLIVYANHPGWWDPLVGYFLAREFFPEHTPYAPIDATALQRYAILGKLGFFGVDPNNSVSLAEFLGITRKILSTPGGSLWITPQGRFRDPRDPEINFEPGLAHIASRMKTGLIVPLAIEYPFWEERHPEALVNFGDPIAVADRAGLTKGEWHAVLVERLCDAQDELAAAAISREAARFEVIIRGRSGAGGVYDWFRRGRATLRGRKFQSHHGEKLR